MRWLFGWRYISSLHSADELQQERNSFPLLRSCVIGSCHVGVSKRFSRSISLAVFCLYTHFILADQISCRSYVGSVYRMWSLALSYSYQIALNNNNNCNLYSAFYMVSITKCALQFFGWIIVLLLYYRIIKNIPLNFFEFLCHEIIK